MTGVWIANVKCLKKCHNYKRSFSIRMFLVNLILIGIIGFCVLYVILKIVQYFSFVSYRLVEENPEIETPEVNNLKILQLNVFWRPWLLHLGTVEHVEERSKILADMLDPYDIVTMNESFHFGSHVAENFVEIMKSKGFKYIVTSDQVPIFSHFIIDSGLMILSKYPIIQANSCTYSQGCSFDQFGAKGSIYARIKIGAKEHIHVFTTHLQASYEVITNVDFGVRNSQQIELIRFIKSNATDGSPIILCGDFNIDSRLRTVVDGKEEFENLMENISLNDYKLEDTTIEKDGSHPVTITEFVPPKDGMRKDTKCLDYIFIYHKPDKHIEYEAKVNKMAVSGKVYDYVSDHYAVECDVQLR